jgi:hypothetical protein
MHATHACAPCRSVEPVPHSIAPGLLVRIAGFSDPLRALLGEVLAALRGLHAARDRFDITKERFMRGLRNWRTRPPYQWAGRLREEAMHTGARASGHSPPVGAAGPACMDGMHAGVYSLESTIAALAAITHEELQEFVDGRLWEVGRVEALLVGNVARNDAERIGADLASVLTARATTPLEAADLDHYRLVALPQGSPVTVHMHGRNPDDANSAHMMLFQMHQQGSARTCALTDLTDQLLHRCPTAPVCPFCCILHLISSCTAALFGACSRSAPCWNPSVRALAQAGRNIYSISSPYCTTAPHTALVSSTRRLEHPALYSACCHTELS